MLWGNAITILGIVSVFFSGITGKINLVTLAVGTFIVLVGIIVAFNQVKEKQDG
jgi:hypothetical protein